MPSKTLFTPEEQFKRTAQYMRSLGYDIRHHNLWVAKTTHRLFCPGDIFAITCSNGMHERCAMTGISSKGARLHNYYIFEPPCVDVVKLPDGLIVYNGPVYDGTVRLPDDLVDFQWDDPAVRRFVADLRASSRRRVGASIPAPRQKASSTQGADELRFDGYYRSRWKPRRHKNLLRWRKGRGYSLSRNYLLFRPDGTVFASFNYDYYETPSMTPSWVGPLYGKFVLEGNAISFSIQSSYGFIWERSEGRIDGEYLRLSRHYSTRQGRSHERNEVLKFMPCNSLPSGL